MNKKYRSLRKTGWTLVVYCLIPFIVLLFDRSLDFPFMMRVIIYPLLGLSLYLHSRKTVVEIRDGRLIFYEGVGLHDPSDIAVDRIDGLERKARNFLTIRYDGDKLFSVETDKTVLDQLEDDLHGKQR